MIDLNVKDRLPLTYDDLMNNFKLPGILPGGEHCMMNTVGVAL